VSQSFRTSLLRTNTLCDDLPPHHQQECSLDTVENYHIFSTFSGPRLWQLRRRSVGRRCCSLATRSTSSAIASRATKWPAPVWRTRASYRGRQEGRASAETAPSVRAPRCAFPRCHQCNPGVGTRGEREVPPAVHPPPCCRGVGRVDLQRKQEAQC